jgi:transposase
MLRASALWLFVRDRQSLDEVEREDLAAFCQASTALEKAYDLVLDFLLMVLQQRGTSTGYVVRAGRKL